MSSSRILVSGFPDGTSKTELMIYFQSVRESGGGDVESIEIDRRVARVNFEEAQVAERVFSRPHTFKDCTLQVSRMPLNQGKFSRLEEKRSASQDEFEYQDTRQNIRRQRNSTTEEAPSPEESASAASAQSGSPIPKECTIEVTGLPEGASEDLVTNYFENARRSKGGPVSTVVMTPELRKCLVTFESPDDAERTINHSSHVLSGASLQVSLFVEEDESAVDFVESGEDEDEDYDGEDGITIIVSGIMSSTSEDAVTFYFENSRRSGGGDVSDLHWNEKGEAVITFFEVKDPQRLLEQPHKIDGQEITVVRQPPPKKVPFDPVRVHVQGIGEKTTKDCLSFYLEKFADIDVEEVYLGCMNNALAVFEREPDFESLFYKVNNDRKGLEGKKPRLERVTVCSCILVSGLKKETTDDTIELYFENKKRSNGGDVSKVERIGRDQAIVHFEDPLSVQQVTKRSQTQAHTLEGVKLKVTPYYPFLDNAGSKVVEMTFDPAVYEYIKTYHKSEFLTLVEEYKVEVEFSDDSTVAISPMGSKSDPSWEEEAEGFKSFLLNFKKSDVPVPSEIFDEVSKRWQGRTPPQGETNCLVSFDEHRRLAVIIGKKVYVEQEEQKLNKLVHVVKEDSELMKSVVRVVETNYPKSKLILLEMSGLCEKLGEEYRHLTISVDSKKEKLCFDGPRKNIHEVKLEVITFISKIAERTTELPPKVIDVLKQDRVSTFIQDLLKQNSVQAVILYDEGHSPNEVQVVGVDVRNAKDAESMLQNYSQEKNIPLTPENAQVLESSLWKDFQSSLVSKFKIGIEVEESGRNVWVRGITKDAEECFHTVKEFLNRNTILYTAIPVQEGSARFISTVWKEKLDGIKNELVDCSIDMRVSTNHRGIEISGTAEGLEKCLSLIQNLVSAVQKESIRVETPGMTKFFMEDKGNAVLKTVGEKNKCVILTSEHTEDEIMLAMEDDEESVAEAGESICSFSTKGGKRISILKGDITKERTDAIVNAANDELRHIGGLAAAIVRAGGEVIQDECNNYVAQNGRLLEGHAMVTGAGRLPCKQVIHAVGPKWNREADKQKRNGEETRQERYLKHAITNSLEKAKQLKSMSIPAVSSGVFGFPRDLCAKIILDAVLEFCNENPHSNLSEIHLINNDVQTVEAFHKDFKNRFAGEPSYSDNKRSGASVAISDLHLRGASRVKKLPTTKTFTTGGIRITVKSGDLSKEQADILVGTAASNLNLSQNPCAKALSQVAGPVLQQECTNLGHVSVGDIAVNSQPGSLRCNAVIFAVCSNWENGKGKKVLRNLISKCLKETAKRGSTSIAFAAIGTGTLQFPRKEVAEIFFDEVVSYEQSNPTTTIKEVRFVPYDQDRPTVQAFEDELKKRKKNNMPQSPSFRNQRAKTPQTSSIQRVGFTPVRERYQDQFETTVGALCLKVQSGDITKETTDAIVLISNEQLTMHGGIAKVILSAGGDSIQEECTKRGAQRPGSVVVTHAGRLKASFVFHIVPPTTILDMKSIKESMMKCLQEAERKGISSISFPAIGTGVFGLSPKTCAEAMLSAIRDFQDHQPASLQLVKMILFDEEMITDFRLALREASGEIPSEKPGLFQRAFSKVGEYLGLKGQEKVIASLKVPPKDYSKKIELVLFAACKEDIKGAIEEINDITKENSIKKVVENNAITQFSKEHFRKMHTLEQRYDVAISVEKAVGRIVVHGQADDLLDVVGEIHKILHHITEEEHKRKRAEMIAKDIQWTYEDGNTMEVFESDTNAEIEIAYQDQKTSVTISSEDAEFKINLKKMIMKSFDGDIIKLQRVDLRKGVELPGNWIPQPKDPQGIEQTVHLVHMDPTRHAQEYQDVQKRFQQTCGNQIVKIERVQNPVLHGTYMIRKQKMDVGKGSNEQRLFHGTPGENCQLINKTGFNRSFHGKNATVYGNGVYFARDASYSARSNYSPADSTGQRYMYLTRVLVGEYTVGRQGLLTPPPKNPNDPTVLFDSVVDQNPNPTIFVVFYDWQCYPEYLITFV